MTDAPLTLEQAVGPVRYTIACALAKCTSDPMKDAPVWWGIEAKAIVKALEVAGYAVVPKEPTQEMLRAAVECRHGPATYRAVPKAATDAYEEEARDDFGAMVSASPPPPGSVKEPRE